MGKGGDDEMWCCSLALFPLGIVLIALAYAIQPHEGMTAEIKQMLIIIGFVSIAISIGVQATLRYFFLKDIDDLKVDVKQSMKERKRVARRRQKRRNLKSSLQISIPGFEDVKIRPKLEDISDSDSDGSEEPEVDPESKW